MNGDREGWDPTQYLRFSDERLRPAIDLIARLDHPGAVQVVDLGCGAGNALPLLAARFPGATISGVDGSAAMLARAAEAGFATHQADIARWAPPGPVDVLFSNAALHWLPDHAGLFPRLLGTLAPGGTLAVQMPAMHDAPLRALQDQIARQGRWAERLRGVSSAPPILSAGDYYNLLRPRVARLEMWFTEYVHVLQGADPVVQWAMGSSLRPYLDALDEAERPDFLAAYGEALRPHYPTQADGTVLLPFRRFFLLASM
ncbi:methyltransferase domain-containing protein [Teichococcus aestuarii]|uniref:methyltransferase domain-containing protein n=1 Tax=Teichococcus aestuarii TaxID=568898 RepID=UPI00360AC4D0